MPALKRYAVLDSYRYLAAAAVVLYHCEANFAPLLQTQAEILEKFRLCVDFFFVLSGFVLMHSYSGRLATLADYGRFMQKRIARVYPLHAAVTLAFIVLSVAVYALKLPVRDASTFDLAQAPWHLLLLHAWGFSTHPALNFPSWSISSEFFVYLLFPVLALLVARLGPCRTLAAALVFALAMTALRESLGLRPWTQTTFDFGNLRAVPSFMAGMAVQALVARQPGVRMSWLWPHAFAALLVALALLRVHDLAIVLLLPAFIAATALAERGGAPTRLATPLWQSLGDASYGVYLLHTPVILLALVLLRKFGFSTPLPLAVAAVLILLATTLLARAGYRLFEKPANLWLGRRAFFCGAVALDQPPEG